MKIRATRAAFTYLTGPSGTSLLPGREYDVSDAVGKRLVEGGFAEPVRDQPQHPAARRATKG